MAESIKYIYQIIDRFTPALKKITAGTKQFQRTMKKTSAVTDRIGQKLNTLSTFAGAAASAIGGKIALDKFTSFDAAMNKLESVTFATEDQMIRMRETAKQLGATTQFTAGQAAEGMTYLAMAGLDTEKVLKAIPGALQLAAAGGIELGQAADIATNVLGQMGMQVEELAHVNDVLALAQSKANFNITELFEAMRPVGTTAKNLGISLEELTSYLGAMANAGEKGSIAGTLLRNAFTQIAGAGKKQRAIYKALGIDLSKFVDQAGKISNFKGLIEQLQKLDKQGKLTVPVLQALYGDRGFRAVQVLVGTSTKELAKFENQLKSFDGAAKESAAIQMKGLPGAMKAMSSAIEAVVIAVFESGLDKVLIDISNKITDLARTISAANPEMLKIAGIAAAVVTALMPVLMVAGLIMPAISAITAAIGAISLPMVAVAAAVVAVGAAIYQVWKNWDYLVMDFKLGVEAVSGYIDTLKEKWESIKVFTPAGLGKKFGGKIASFFGFGEKGVAAENATTKSTLNGNITVSATPGSKVESAGMKTSAPGNLGFNMAGATP